MCLLVDFDTFYFCKLFDAALYLHRFCGLVAESLYEVFGVGNLLLLVAVGTHLLLYALLAETYELGVVYSVVVYPAARNFNGAVGYVVDKRAAWLTRTTALALVRRKFSSH